MPSVQTEEELLRRMREGSDCYQGRSGDYHLTYGRGDVAREAIDQALAHGTIKPKWDDAPQHQYWRLAVLTTGK